MRGRRWIRTFLGLCLCLCLCLLEVEGLQQFEREPQDNEPTLGETITLPCQVKDRKGAVQWTRDGFGLGFPRDLPSFRRYSMVGNEADGGFPSLNLSLVTVPEVKALVFCTGDKMSNWASLVKFVGGRFHLREALFYHSLHNIQLHFESRSVFFFF